MDFAADASFQLFSTFAVLLQFLAGFWIFLSAYLAVSLLTVLLIALVGASRKLAPSPLRHHRSGFNFR